MKYKKYSPGLKGCSAMLVSFVVRSNTTLSTTQYYLAFIGDSCAHFKRRKYRLKYALASDHCF